MPLRSILALMSTVDVLEERLPREEKVPQRAVDELDLFRVLMANGTAGR